MSENSSLIYEKSDVLWVNPYIINQQQQQKQKQQQNQQIHFVSRNGKMWIIRTNMEDVEQYDTMFTCVQEKVL